MSISTRDLNCSDCAIFEQHQPCEACHNYRKPLNDLYMVPDDPKHKAIIDLSTVLFMQRVPATDINEPPKLQLVLLLGTFQAWVSLIAGLSSTYSNECSRLEEAYLAYKNPVPF